MEEAIIEDTVSESAPGLPDNVVPLARYRDQHIIEAPEDLYIPPEALKIFLEAFEGPLDLLLYLIRKNDMDILDIPVAEITLQYTKYIEVMQTLEIELAADYLVMAATLAEIKSRLLLPRVVNDEGEEVDPRADLVRQLQEYEQFKIAGENLNELPIRGRDFFMAKTMAPDLSSEVPLPEATMRDLILAMQDVIRRAELNASHSVVMEPLSIRERMSQVLERCQSRETLSFSECFTLSEGRPGVVVTFIAMLELLKQDLISIVQTEIFAPIYLKAKVA